jgi:hypothetical protein
MLTGRTGSPVTQQRLAAGQVGVESPVGRCQHSDSVVWSMMCVAHLPAQLSPARETAQAGTAAGLLVPSRLWLRRSHRHVVA